MGKEALKTGSYILGDIANQRPLAESVKTRFTESAQSLKRKADEKISQLTGSGAIKKKRVSNKHHKVSSVRKSNTAKKNKKGFSVARNIFH